MADQRNAGNSAGGCVAALFTPIAIGVAIWVAWLIFKAMLTAVGNGATSAVRDIPVIPPGAHDSLTLAYAVYAVALAVVVPMVWDTFRRRANPALVAAVFVALGVAPAVLLNVHVKAGYLPYYAACGSLWTPLPSFVPQACTAQLDSLFQWIATIAIGAVVVPIAYVGWVSRKGEAKPDKPEASS